MCLCVCVCMLYLYLCRERAPFVVVGQRCLCNWSRRIHLFVSMLRLCLRLHLRIRLHFSLCHCLLIVADICPVCVYMCAVLVAFVIRGVKWIFYFYYYDFIVFRVSVFSLLLAFSSRLPLSLSLSLSLVLPLCFVLAIRIL